MKYFLLTILFATLSAPVMAHASDPYDFHYQFQFVYQKGKLNLEGGYYMATGVSAPTTGPWKIYVIGPHGQTISSWPFDPTAQGGRPVTFIPYANSGTTLRVIDAKGQQALSVDLSWNRVCDEDGQCAADRGEDGSNCPADCSGQAGLAEEQAATIAQGLTPVTPASVIGLVLMRLGLAGVGLLLLFMVVRTLDSRAR